MSVNLDGFGFNESVDVTGNKTLALTDCGIVQNVTATCTLTLLATIAGANFWVRVGKPGITVTVAPAAADQIAGNGFTATDNKALILTNQPAGSLVKLTADATNGWVIDRLSGTATRQA